MSDLKVMEIEAIKKAVKKVLSQRDQTKTKEETGQKALKDKLKSLFVPKIYK